MSECVISRSAIVRLVKQIKPGSETVADGFQ